MPRRFKSSVGTKDVDLLKEIKDRWTYSLTQWQKIRDEAKEDMRFICGDQWDTRELAARKSEGRPAMVFDELGQYVNQLIGEVTMNPHAVKVTPRGSGDKDKQAEVRADIIREVEYKSTAKAAYLAGAERAFQSSMGCWRITTQYIDDKSFEQEMCIKRLANPDNVLFDPDTKEADASDMNYAYIVDQVPRDEYKRKYPKAEIVDFSNELMQSAPSWIKESAIQVAEYWRVEIERRKLMLVQLPKAAGPEVLYEDELKEMQKLFPDLQIEVLQERRVDERKITQYITNGVEILEENEWLGQWIPIVPVLGRELYVDFGSGPQRVLMSLIRLARGPQRLLNYLRTNEMEEAAMSPKTPFIGVEGQFETHEQEWAEVAKSPKAYLQYKAMTTSTGQQMLQPPQRQPFIPNFAAYEVACEAVRRAIQAAMGISNLPTAAQRMNEKSGVALKKIESQQQKGSYQFINNFLMSLEHSGRIMNDLLDKIYDTPRSVGARRADGTHYLASLNDQANEKAIDITGDAHDVTISTGPSFESQREEAADFADTIAQVPGVFPLIGDLLVRLRNLGPIGETIAKRLTPPQYQTQDGQEPPSPQVTQKMQQMQQQAQALNAYAQKLEEEVKKLQEEKQGKIVDNQYKMNIEKMKIEASVTIAEIGAKVQEAQTRMKMEIDMWQQLHGQTHEASMQAMDHAQEAEIEQQKQAAAADQQKQQQEAEASQQQTATPAQ